MNDEMGVPSFVNENAEKARLEREKEKRYNASKEARRAAQEKARKQQHKNRVKAIIAAGIVIGGITTGVISNEQREKKGFHDGTNTVITTMLDKANKGEEKEFISELQKIESRYNISKEEFDKDPTKNYCEIVSEHLSVIKEKIAKENGIGKEDSSSIKIYPGEKIGTWKIYYGEQVLNTTDEIKDLINIQDEEKDKSGKVVGKRNPDYKDYTTAYNNTTDVVVERDEEK